MAYLPSPLPLRTAISLAVCGWALSALSSTASDTTATQQAPAPLEAVTIIGDPVLAGLYARGLAAAGTAHTMMDVETVTIAGLGTAARRLAEQGTGTG